MREILFRGKRKVCGEWVQGFLFVSRKGEHKIKWYDPHYGSAKTSEVFPETVGQFTGLTDKNGKKIFEGDIIQYSNPDEDIIHGTVAYGDHSYCGTHEVGFFVEWEKSEWAMLLRKDIGFWVNCREIEIIGNIHDNPELLGGAEDG